MKKIAFLFGFTLLLGGCGEIEIPPELSSLPPSPTEIAQISISPSLLPGQSPFPTPLDPNTENINGLSECLQEKGNLSQAIIQTQTELKTCEEERQRLDSIVQTSLKQGKEQELMMQGILKEYFAKVPQEEYAFLGSACGPLGLVTSLDWYAGFSQKLDEQKIPFTPLARPLKATDFFRVCASDEGKIALFVGARADNKYEFHLLKYNFVTGEISAALLLDGSCEICPDVFGKRRGAYIELSGGSGANTAEYQYFYDKNIIFSVPKSQ
jgi:hypothetical protein